MFAAGGLAAATPGISGAPLPHASPRNPAASRPGEAYSQFITPRPL